jgi:hypothetical protein
LHEGYHANWSDIRMPDRINQIHLRWPLVIRGLRKSTAINIGTFHVVADANAPNIHDCIADLTLRLADLEPQIQSVIATLERQHAAALSDGEVAGTEDLPLEDAVAGRVVESGRVEQSVPLVTGRH